MVSLEIRSTISGGSFAGPSMPIQPRSANTGSVKPCAMKVGTSGSFGEVLLVDVSFRCPHKNKALRAFMRTIIIH